jgi:hypothetical protein
VSLTTDESGKSPAARVWHWTLGNWDTLLALALAGVFGVLGAVGGASDEAVRGMTLAVLGLLAVALIRLRGAREKADVHLADMRQSLDEHRVEVRAMETGAPWRVLDCQLTYDLESRDLARFEKWRRLHFYRNDVMSVHDWFSGDGWSDEETCTPGHFVAAPNEPETPMKFRIGQEEYTLIAFSGFYRRGDEDEFVIKRTMHESFPKATAENVSIDVKDETARARLKVIWPAGHTPSKVWIQGKRINYELVPLSSLAELPDGRASYTYELRQPDQGDDAYIYWNW